MKYWVRENGSPPFHGPYTAEEVANEIRNGRLPEDCELLEATGQSYGEIKRAAVGWKRAKEAGLPSPKNRMADDVRHSTGLQTEFPALQAIAGIHKLVAIFSFVLGTVGILILFLSTPTNWLGVVVTVVWTILVPLLLWGSGEFILVFLRIEQNTRRTNELVGGRDIQGIRPDDRDKQ